MHTIFHFERSDFNETCDGEILKSHVRGGGAYTSLWLADFKLNSMTVTVMTPTLFTAEYAKRSCVLILISE